MSRVLLGVEKGSVFLGFLAIDGGKEMDWDRSRGLWVFSLIVVCLLGWWGYGLAVDVL